MNGLFSIATLVFNVDITKKICDLIMKTGDETPRKLTLNSLSQWKWNLCLMTLPSGNCTQPTTVGIYGWWRIALPFEKHGNSQGKSTETLEWWIFYGHLHQLIFLVKATGWREQICPWRRMMQFDGQESHDFRIWLTKQHLIFERCEVHHWDGNLRDAFSRFGKDSLTQWITDSGSVVPGRTMLRCWSGGTDLTDFVQLSMFFLFGKRHEMAVDIWIKYP